jgi:hypothetical protein
MFFTSFNKIIKQLQIKKLEIKKWSKNIVLCNHHILIEFIKTQTRIQ